MPESSRVGDSVQQRYCAGNDFEKTPKAWREQAERIREADQRERRGKEEVELGQLRLVSVVKFNLTCDSNATNSYTQWQSRRVESKEGERLLVSRQKPNSEPQYTQATLPGHKKLNENA